MTARAGLYDCPYEPARAVAFLYRSARVSCLYCVEGRFSLVL